MEENKNKFLEKVKNDLCRTLKEEAESASSFGSFVNDSNFNQHAFRGEATLEEICHIRPTNPLFKPGTLLTSPDGIHNEDDMHGMLKCASSDEEMNVSIDIGTVKDIEELGEFKRYLVAETIMVTDETIQIRKHVSVRAADGTDKVALRQSCVYTVRHLLHCLDNKRKVFVPTKMFKEHKGRYASDLVMVDQIDLETIFHLYKTSNPEEIVEPLKIHKK